jgi:hypothetical protein
MRASFSSIAVAMLVACGGGSSSFSPRQGALVAEGRVSDAAGVPIGNAVVHVEALWPGTAGGEFGCSGTYLVGDWSMFSASDGRFGIEMRLTAPDSPTCIIVLGSPPGDAVARDTASALAQFTRTTAGVAPDTVHLDLRFPR